MNLDFSTLKTAEVLRTQIPHDICKNTKGSETAGLFLLRLWVSISKAASACGISVWAWQRYVFTLFQGSQQLRHRSPTASQRPTATESGRAPLQARGALFSPVPLSSELPARSASSPSALELCLTVAAPPTQSKGNLAEPEKQRNGSTCRRKDGCRGEFSAMMI